MKFGIGTVTVATDVGGTVIYEVTGIVTVPIVDITSEDWVFVRTVGIVSVRL